MSIVTTAYFPSLPILRVYNFLQLDILIGGGDKMKKINKSMLILLLITIFFAAYFIIINFNRDTDQFTIDKVSESKSSEDDEKETIINEGLEPAPSESDLFFNEPEGNIENASIKIYKSARRLEFYGNGGIIGKFKIGLGRQPIGDKKKEGDRKTPEGEYYICVKNDKSRFTLSLGISYPNIEDAKEALEEGIIDNGTFTEIENAINGKRKPPWKTALGGEIMIHGGGNSSDWTWGCIALSDEDVKILWKYVSIGTPVTIYK